MFNPGDHVQPKSNPGNHAIVIHDDNPDPGYETGFYLVRWVGPEDESYMSVDDVEPYDPTAGA
jgi:hypothetical protein